MYLGEITHRDQSYPGAHPAIVPVELFEAVQAKLASQRHTRQARPQRSAAMALKGLLFDAGGAPMSPAFGYGRHGRVYRYYVSAPLQQGRKPAEGDDVMLRRISAPAVEERLRGELARRMGAPDDATLAELLRPVRRIELERAGVRIAFSLKDLPRVARAGLEPHVGDAGLGELHLALACRARGGRTWVSAPEGARPLRRDAVLIRGLRQGHRIAAGLGWRLSDGALTSLDATAPESGYARRLCRLAFLAPDLQAAILEGRQPDGLTLDQLLRCDIPTRWSRQRELFSHAF